MEPLVGIATTAIAAAVFVERDPNGGAKRRIQQGTANGRVIGIGPEYSAAALESVPYRVSGYSKLTMGGTVTAGDRLKSDANGKGVGLAVGGTVPQNIGALAVEDGVSGDVKDVQIEIYTEQPGDYLS